MPKRIVRWPRLSSFRSDAGGKVSVITVLTKPYPTSSQSNKMTLI
jgi:hypothetical protein